MNRLARALILAAVAMATPARAQPASDGGPVLRGRILDPSGTPRAGVGITVGDGKQITTDDALARPVARSDGDGRFECTVPRGNAVLIAGKGLAALRMEFWARTPVVDVGVIQMLPGVEIRGRTHNDNGTGIAGVRVEARDLLVGALTLPHRVRAEHFTSAVSNADGDVVLCCAAVSGAQLVSFKPGYYSVVNSSAPADRPFDACLRPSGFVSGSVVNHLGRPYPAEITVDYEVFAGAIARRFRTRPDGTFELPLAQPTRYRLRLRPTPISEPLPGPVASSARGGLVIEVNDQRPRVDVVAVAAESGEPVSEFTADLHPVMHTLDPTRLQGAPASITTEHGHVVLGLPHDRRRWRGVVSVRAPDRSAVVARYRVNDAGGVALITARLPREAPLLGTVAGAGAGVLVWVTRQNENPGAGAHFGFGGLPEKENCTDSEGNFRIDNLAKGDYVLFAFDPASGRSAAREISLSAAKPRAVTLVLPAAVSVRGTVAQQGGPTSVILTPEDQDISGDNIHYRVERHFEALLDGEGRFALNVPPGTYQVTLQHHFRTAAGVPAPIPMHSVVVRSPMELELADTAPPRSSIRGKVNLSGEAKLARVAVVAIPEAVPGTAPASSVIDDDGVFSMPAGAGSYTVTLYDLATGLTLTRLARPVRVSANEAASLEIALDLRQVTVRLRPRGDTPVVDCLVVTTDEEDAARRSARQEWLNPLAEHRPLSTMLRYAGRGVELAPDQCEARFFAPAGSYTVRAMNRSSFLLAKPNGTGTLLSQEKIKVTLAGPNMFELEVDKPPAIAVLERSK